MKQPFAELIVSMFLGLKKGELNDPKNITLGVPKTEGHYNVTHYSKS
jgi:hypothetical protein